MDNNKTTLEVGDKILIENWYRRTAVTITRVTKTMAIAHIARKDGTTYDYRFKRECKGGNIHPIPRIDFDTTKRTLL